MAIYAVGVATPENLLGSNLSGTQNVSALSASFWLQVISPTPNTIFTLSGGLSDTDRRFSVQTNSTGIFRFTGGAIDGAARTNRNFSGISTTGGDFNHFVVCLSYTQDVINLYKNGELVADEAFSAGATNTSNTPSRIFTLFSNGGTDDYIDLAVEDLRIYNRFVGPLEAKTIYTSRGSDAILEGMVYRIPFSTDLPPGTSYSQVNSGQNWLRQGSLYTELQPSFDAGNAAESRPSVTNIRRRNARNISVRAFLG